MRLRNVSRVAIIGGGPAGVAAAKYLIAEKTFSRIDIYEQRSAVGGVWNYTPENDAQRQYTVPQTEPGQPLDKPIWRRSRNSDTIPTERATFISPMYERLEANLPKQLMQHSDFPFPDGDQLFPTHASISKYLERYAESVTPLIRFGQQVVSVWKEEEAWQLRSVNLASQATTFENYDALIVASGHYNIPFIPERPGLQSWAAQYPDAISHSKFYRKPEDYRDKKVLIVGHGPSGADIAYQIAQFSASPILVSTRAGASDTPDDQHQRFLGGIEEFLPHSAARPQAIRFTGGHIEADIDHVVFCTGYLYSYPFLPKTNLSLSIISDGQRVNNVYQHIFYIADPSLTFLTLPWNIVPFPTAEAQSAAVARVFAGRLDLPSREEMQDWERTTIKKNGSGKSFHKLPPPLDIDYINDLHHFCMQADNEPSGKIGPYWGFQQQWMRYNVGVIKQAFLDRGKHRASVKTLSQLGFHLHGQSKDVNGHANGR